MTTARVRSKKKKIVVKIPGLDHETLNQMVEIFKSLSDDNRLQIVLLLAKQGDMNVTEICNHLNQSQPAVSHHLTQLKKAHLVDSSREGKFNFYTLDSTLLRKLIGVFYPNSGSAQQELIYGDLKLLFKAK